MQPRHGIPTPVPEQCAAENRQLVALTCRRSAPVRVVLVAERRLWVEVLSASLRSHGHQVVVETTDAHDAIAACLSVDPDVCLLGGWTPDADGLEAVTRISSTTRSKVLVLAARSVPGDVRTALDAGAAGFVAEGQRFDDILHAIDQLSVGETSIPAVTTTAAPRPEPEIALLRFLTRREREALRWIAEGQSTIEIARSMHVAYSTARTHVQNVLTKLGVRSRLQAAALVAHAGLLAELDRQDAMLGAEVIGDGEPNRHVGTPRASAGVVPV